MPSRQNVSQPEIDDCTEVLDVPADLLALFDKHLGPLPEPRRPDEFTAPELARARHITLTRATVVLRELLDAGRVTRRHGIPSNNYWYRFVEYGEENAA